MEPAAERGRVGRFNDAITPEKNGGSVNTGEGQPFPSMRMAYRSQFGEIGRHSHLNGWPARIERGAFLAALVTIIFLHGVGTLLTFLAFAQFCQAVVLFRRVLRRDSLRPSLAVVEGNRIG